MKNIRPRSVAVSRQGQLERTKKQRSGKHDLETKPHSIADHEELAKSEKLERDLQAKGIQKELPIQDGKDKKE
jgi:hypothetical protein